MPAKTDGPDALDLSWKLSDADMLCPDDLLERLTWGESHHLYKLLSWVIANGEARALLAPTASLEEIARLIWDDTSLPTRSRWISGSRDCAFVSWEIEKVPVDLGLAERPEQWPFSSAAVA